MPKSSYISEAQRKKGIYKVDRKPVYNAGDLVEDRHGNICEVLGHARAYVLSLPVSMQESMKETSGIGSYKVITQMKNEGFKKYVEPTLDEKIKLQKEAISSLTNSADLVSREKFVEAQGLLIQLYEQKINKK